MTVEDFKNFFEVVNPPDNTDVYIDEGSAFGKYLIDSLTFKNGKMIIQESYEQVLEED